MAETPTYTAGNVFVGIASLFTAPANTPAPADSVAQNAISTPWVPVGATEEGVSLQWQRSLQDIHVEEQSTPVNTQVTSSTFNVNTSLSEDTIATMKLAFGGGTITTVAPGTTQVGKSVLTLSDTLDQLAVVMEAQNPLSFWRRLYIPSVLSVAEVTTAYRRAANNRSYSLQLRAVCAINQIQMTDMTANHT
jgi:hypothetical protein